MQPNHFHRGLQRLNNAHWEQVLWKPHRVAPASISNLPKESTILRFSTQGCWDVSHGRLWHFERGQRLIIMLDLDSHSLICSANIQVWKDACLNIYSNILTQVGTLDSQNLTIFRCKHLLQLPWSVGQFVCPCVRTDSYSWIALHSVKKETSKWIFLKLKGGYCNFFYSFIGFVGHNIW